jgi:leader peptidase (prepilin peptidase)/N-methyltransferase
MGTGLGPAFDALLAGIFGLLIGSFLNVVIYRLPKMMERQWAQECAELADKPPEEPTEKFNLLVPRSRCSSCGHVIRWYENIPVASYLFLRGKCSVCGTPYGLRYPVVEAVMGGLFFFCVWRWGWSLTALAWCGFSAALLALAMIDWDTTLLPDDITLPLLWAGLIVAALQWNPAVNLPTALWGAVAGYLSLWLVYWASSW